MSKIRRPFVNVDGSLKELPTDFQLEVNADEKYVPIASISSSSASGIKGQWSYGIVSWGAYPNEPSYVFCIATNTWVEITLGSDLFNLLAGYLKISEITESYVPISQLINQDSTGIKGQWSVIGTRYFVCIATNTWMEITGATTFIV